MKKRRGGRRPGATPSTRAPPPAPRSGGEWGWRIPQMPHDPQQVRVGIFTDSYLPRISGVVRSVESFVAELRRRGHHASIFAPAYRGFVDTDPDVVGFLSVLP